jgi:hypothetical protein
VCHARIVGGGVCAVEGEGCTRPFAASRVSTNLEKQKCGHLSTHITVVVACHVRHQENMRSLKPKVDDTRNWLPYVSR